MTAFYRVQVSWVNDSGDPIDVAMNTWHFRSDEVSSADLDMLDISAALNTFYLSFDQHMSANLTGTLEKRTYQLLDPEPRQPGIIESTGFTPGTTALPNELAVCLSYRAAYESGASKRRRRGRIYLGPWAATSSEFADGTGDARVATTLRAAINDAAPALVGALPTPNGNSIIEWCVFSRADYEDAAPPGVENSVVGLSAAFHPVVGGKVDNAFDIQRRRGRISDADSEFGAGF